MTVIKYQTKTQYKFSVCIFLPSLQSVVCILYQVCSLHSAFCTDRTGIAVFVRNKNKSGKQRLFFQNCDFITQYLLIKKQETQKRSHNHLNKSVTKHLSTVTFLTFFVEACRYGGKHCPWNSTYSIAAILTITQTNIWILITPFLTQVSSLKKKASSLPWFTNVSCLHIFFFSSEKRSPSNVHPA